MPIKPRRLSDFMGSAWRVSRQIKHADGTDATFSGQATWRAAPGGAIYEEVGTLCTGCAQVEAHQVHLWDGQLNVHFQDGRFFHAVPPRGGPVHHECPPDTYVGLYDFAAEDAFTLRWRVTGPRKDYTMLTNYCLLSCSNKAEFRQYSGGSNKVECSA